jgi:hypothetical protein
MGIGCRESLQTLPVPKNTWKQVWALSDFQNYGVLDALGRGPLSELKRVEVDMRYVGYGLIAILFSILVLPLSALAVPLSNLIDNGESITEGDKLFSNFTGSLDLFDATFGGAFPRSLSGIDVSGITVGGEQRLQFGPGFGVVFGAVLSLHVEFDVTVTDPSLSIRRSELVLPRVHLGGDAFFRFQSFFAFTFDPEFLDLGPLIAPVSLGPTGGHVTAELILASGGVPGSVDADDIYLALSQSVPEPSIVLLLVFGAGAIAAIASKIRQVSRPRPSPRIVGGSRSSGNF